MAKGGFNIQEGALLFWSKRNVADGKAMQIFQATSPEGRISVVKDENNILTFSHIYIGKGITDVKRDISNLDPNKKHSFSLFWSVKNREIYIYVDKDKGTRAKMKYD